MGALTASSLIRSKAPLSCDLTIGRRGAHFSKKEKTMITSGTILLAKDAPRPPCIQVEDHLFPDAWVSVAHNPAPHELERNLTAAGWAFFYMAGAVTATAFGFDQPSMIRAALHRVITSVSRQRCNCLEIDAVSTHSFLGIGYVSLSAHPRHIQRSMVFSGQ